MKKPLVNPVLPEHVAEFDLFVKKWQEILNLKDWRIERSTQPAGKGAMAQISVDPDARLAIYQLGVSFGVSEVTPESLERTAMHELMHVVLHPLKTAKGAKA